LRSSVRKFKDINNKNPKRDKIRKQLDAITLESRFKNAHKRFDRLQNEFEEAKRGISEELNFLISENERLSRLPDESQKTKERIKSLKKANDIEIDKLEAGKARVDEVRDHFLSLFEEALDQSFHSLHNNSVTNP
jgi:hypothetical protein